MRQSVRRIHGGALRRITALVLAVLGIVLITDSLALFGQTMSLLDVLGQPDYPPMLWSFLGTVLTTLLTFGAGVLLVVRRDRVAAFLVQDEAPVAFDPADMLRLALMVIGVWLVVTSLPQLIGTLGDWLYRVVLGARDQLDDATMTLSTWSQGMSALTGVIQVAAGLFLLSKAGVLSKGLWFGAATSVEPEGADPELAYQTCPHCGAAFDPTDYVDLSTALCSTCRQPLGDSV